MAVEVEKVDVQVNVWEDSMLDEEVVVVEEVVVLGALLVVVVLGELEEVVGETVDDVVVDAGVDVEEEGAVVVSVVDPGVEVEEPLESAKYAAAAATAITTTSITARKTVATPLEEACK